MGWSGNHTPVVKQEKEIMKRKHAFLVFLGLSCFLGLIIFGSVQSNSKNSLKLDIESSKESYNLGEVLALTFELKNQSGEEITVTDVFGIGGGLLSVHISQDGKNFQEYFHPGWGLVEYVDPRSVLKPDETVKTSATVLWTWKGDEKSEYAFPAAGNYFIKARYNAIIKGQTTSIPVESEPLKITVNEPAGDDLKVWNKIKDDARFAYFIQHNDLPIQSYKIEERNKFQAKIEQLINQYPNSFYTESLRQSLDKFKLGEEKRNAFGEKLNEQTKPQ